MNDDSMKQAMEHARDLQEKLAQTLGESDKLRAALMEQARRSADATHEQTKAALDDLEAAMKSGAETLQRFLRGNG